MPPSFSLPPLLCAFGVTPSHAANCRPYRKMDAFDTVATMALAVIGRIRASGQVGG